MERNRTLRRIIERDNHLCGIHYGGCGKEIKSTDSANIDHIIPKTLLKKKQGDSVFFKPNFLQPMHSDCNSIDKRGQLTKYPEFTCDCHYTYFNVETETVEIYFQHYFKHNDTFEWRKETFVENFIDHNKDGFGHIMAIGNRGSWYGFQRDSDMGSLFKQYKKTDLYICYLLNIFALLKCKRIEESKEEYIKYLAFIADTHSYSRPATMDKVTKLFEALSSGSSTSELSDEILLILNPKEYHYRIGLRKCPPGDVSTIHEGIDHLYKAIELGYDKDQNIASIYNSLGYAYGYIGNYEKSEKYLLKAIKLDSNNEYAKGNLSYLYEIQGRELLEAKRYQSALNLFLKSKDIFSDSIPIYSLIASAYFKLGNLVYAIRYTKEGLKIAPDQEELKQNLHGLEIAERQLLLSIKNQKYVWNHTAT